MEEEFWDETSLQYLTQPKLNKLYRSYCIKNDLIVRNQVTVSVSIFNLTLLNFRRILLERSWLALQKSHWKMQRRPIWNTSVTRARDI
jgi:hypothetical protein